MCAVHMWYVSTRTCLLAVSVHRSVPPLAAQPWQHRPGAAKLASTVYTCGRWLLSSYAQLCVHISYQMHPTMPSNWLQLLDTGPAHECSHRGDPPALSDPWTAFLVMTLRLISPLCDDLLYYTMIRYNLRVHIGTLFQVWLFAHHVGPSHSQIFDFRSQVKIFEIHNDWQSTNIDSKFLQKFVKICITNLSTVYSMS
jgi:hypothetical protein